MTPTEKQKLIAEQAVYGDLQIKYKKVSYGSYKVINYFREMAIDYRCKPILRPMFDLVKEITHKGYNDDKPFIPLVELAKMRYPTCSIFEVRNDCVYCSVQRNGELRLINIFYKEQIGELRFKEIDLLNRLHFDTRGLIESGEAIDVNTLDNNPYEVK